MLHVISSNLIPGPDLSSYCKSLVASARSRIPVAAPEDQLPYRGSIQDHVKFVTDCEAVLYDLIKEPQVQRVAKPTLLHADLHKGTSSFPTASPAKSPVSSTGNLQALSPRSSTPTRHPILQHWSTMCPER